MTAAPSDPFRLLAHLQDDHHETHPGLDRMEAEDLRRHHRQLHEGTCDHDHTG